MKMIASVVYLALLLTTISATKTFKANTSAKTSTPGYTVMGTEKVSLKSWKGDYLHRPDSNQGVTTWSTGIGNEWTLEYLVNKGKINNLVALKSWKGDYLHRPDSSQGVTSWSTGKGNVFEIKYLGGNTIELKSWKGDSLHRPDSNQGVTTWSTGKGNVWTLVFLA
jgi:hypothetical protein